MIVELDSIDVTMGFIQMSMLNLGHIDFGHLVIGCINQTKDVRI